MEEFIRHYGGAVITGLAVLLILAIVLLFKDNIDTAFTNLFNSFTNSVPGVVPGVVPEGESALETALAL